MAQVLMVWSIVSWLELFDPPVACQLGSIVGDRCFVEQAPVAGQSLLTADLLDSCRPGAAIWNALAHGSRS